MSGGTALGAARAVLRRDLTRSWRRRGEILQPLVFFAITVYLFPLAIGPAEQTLRVLLPAIVWVAVLLSMTLTLPEVFAADHADGSLDQLALSPHPLPLLVLMKACAHWLTGAAPVLVLGTALGALFGLDAPTLGALVLGLLLGSPVLSLVGALASALTVGLRGGTLLLALITLPMYIPVLIFGTSAARNAALGLPTAAEMYLLSGLSVLALTLTPWGTAAALRARLG
jgi:heme exporter protein B